MDIKMDIKNRRAVFDIEGDGLEPSLFWCISIIDVATNKLHEFGPEAIKSGLEFLMSYDEVIGHNIIEYDIPHALRLYKIDLKEKKVTDTLVLSRLYNPTQEGNHSLKTWGYKLKEPKIEHDEWGKYSPEMQTRCSSDTKLTLKVLKHLEEKMKYFSEDSIRLEHDVAKIIHEQIKKGWLFNTEGATKLLAKINDELGVLEDTIHQTFKPLRFLVKTVTPKYKKDGSLSNVGLRHEEYKELLISKSTAPFERWEYKNFNIQSRQQIGHWLKSFGWKPTKFTPGGSPQIDESTLEDVQGIPEASLILKYLTLKKITSFLVNWINSVKEDGRQHGYVNTLGAITGRMTHSAPNMAQVPSSRSLYGVECRTLFIVPTSYKQVGIDADGLELRKLAHYMGDPAYIDAVVNGDKDKGTDAHSVNMRAADLTDRDVAKTMFYALVYGAGDSKLGKIVGGKAKEGRALKAKLFKGLPDLGDLIDRVTTAASRGFIKGLDGRIIRIRSAHAALNTLLQGGGAIVMKRALVILYNKVRHLDASFVGNIHDEIQAEVALCDVEEYKRLALESMVEAGEYYKLKCPLKGDVKVGNNWGETH